MTIPGSALTSAPASQPFEALKGGLRAVSRHGGVEKSIK
jgi:hypothetical protein